MKYILSLLTLLLFNPAFTQSPCLDCLGQSIKYVLSKNDYCRIQKNADEKNGTTLVFNCDAQEMAYVFSGKYNLCEMIIFHIDVVKRTGFILSILSSGGSLIKEDYQLKSDNGLRKSQLDLYRWKDIYYYVSYQKDNSEKYSVSCSKLLL